MLKIKKFKKNLKFFLNFFVLTTFKSEIDGQSEFRYILGTYIIVLLFFRCICASNPKVRFHDPKKFEKCAQQILLFYLCFTLQAIQLNSV